MLLYIGIQGQDLYLLTPSSLDALAFGEVGTKWKLDPTYNEVYLQCRALYNVIT